MTKWLTERVVERMSGWSDRQDKGTASYAVGEANERMGCSMDRFELGLIEGLIRSRVDPLWGCAPLSQRGATPHSLQR